jgi:DNA invertase Pin-like site-specific DNA recombinase
MGQQGQRVAIYCRVSTDDQSCERQERDLKAFAERAGYEVVGVFMEKASGARNDRQERKKVLALAQTRQVEAILVTELSRWGRSTKDLVETLDDLHNWGVSMLPLNGQSFDLNSANGKLMRTIVAALAEFERDLIRERIKSGMARAKAAIDRDGHFITKAGKKRLSIGRQAGERPSDKKAKRVLEMAKEGLSYRLIGRNLGMSKNTVMQIVQREQGAL